MWCHTWHEVRLTLKETETTGHTDTGSNSNHTCHRSRCLEGFIFMTLVKLVICDACCELKMSAGSNRNYFLSCFNLFWNRQPKTCIFLRFCPLISFLPTLSMNPHSLPKCAERNWKDVLKRHKALAPLLGSPEPLWTYLKPASKCLSQWGRTFGLDPSLTLLHTCWPC